MQREGKWARTDYPVGIHKKYYFNGQLESEGELNGYGTNNYYKHEGKHVKYSRNGEIIDVKRGYARNFLISTKKALFASSYINWIKNGISMNAPNIIRSTPIAKKTVLLLFIFEVGGYLKIFEIQHNKTLLYLYFTYEI